MEKQSVKEPKSVVFTEQKVFTFGNERFRMSKPLIECDYLTIREGTQPEERMCSFSMGGNSTTQQRGELFLRYAHRLFEKRDIILSDSRLYGVKLPLSTPYCAPTLGDYMVWWKNYRCSQVIDPAGKPQFIHSYWGGFSGVRGVAYLDSDGRNFFVDVESPYYVRASLSEVCKNSDKQYSLYDVLTLEQAIKVLFDED